MMQSSKKNRVAIVSLKDSPAPQKAPLSPLSEWSKPLLARPDQRRRSHSHYTLHDIQKAIDLAG